jgi:hypothetical protein
VSLPLLPRRIASCTALIAYLNILMLSDREISAEDLSTSNRPPMSDP